MFGIKFVKAAPTTHLLHFKNGKLRREGAGISFFYWAPTATLVAVPLESRDVPYVFNEGTADFQAVTIQGQLTFRVRDPKKLAGLLDFSIDANGKHRTDDPEKLKVRLVQQAQVLARAIAGKLALRDVLVSSDAIGAKVLEGLRDSEPVEMLGLEVLSFSILSLKPTPEMARALEAEAREALSRRADEAIYDRRNAAVEQERKIKESELETELAVEAKKRQIREAQIAAEIAVEQQRATLIEQQVENDNKAADSKAYALKATLDPIKTCDWKTLLAVAAPGADPKLMIALAFRELAENAQKIGELNVSPELLTSLTKK